MADKTKLLRCDTNIQLLIVNYLFDPVSVAVQFITYSDRCATADCDCLKSVRSGLSIEFSRQKCDGGCVFSASSHQVVKRWGFKPQNPFCNDDDSSRMKLLAYTGVFTTSGICPQYRPHPLINM